MKKIIKNNVFYILIILYILVDFKFFENSYKLLLNSYEKRLNNIYGVCEKEGYGFVNKNINKKIQETDFMLINKNKNFPSIRGLFYEFSNKRRTKDYIFLLNENNKDLIQKKFKNFQIISNQGNCYLLKKND